MAKSRTFYYWLDPLRAIFALLVLLVHARAIMFNVYGDLDAESQNIFTIAFYLLTGQGQLAVGGFFVLSGFLVGGKTIQNLLRSEVSARRYTLTRFFRLGVPLTGAIILIGLVDYFFYPSDFNVVQLLGQFTGLQGVAFKDAGGVFWTLAYEIWFYIIILGVILLTKSPAVKYLGCGVLTIAGLVIAQLHFIFFAIIAVGIIIFFIATRETSPKILTRIMGFICFPLLLIYILLSTNYLAQLLSFNPTLDLPLLLVSVTAFFLFLAPFLTKEPGDKCSRAINRWGKTWGAFSYSLFLTHYQILKIWKAYMPRFDRVSAESILCFLAVCGVCIIFGYLFSLVTERKTDAIKFFCLRVLGFKSWSTTSASGKTPLE